MSEDVFDTWRQQSPEYQRGFIDAMNSKFFDRAFILASPQKSFQAFSDFKQVITVAKPGDRIFAPFLTAEPDRLADQKTKLATLLG